MNFLQARRAKDASKATSLSKGRGQAKFKQITFGHIAELHNACNSHAGFIYRIVLLNGLDVNDTPYYYYGKKNFRQNGHNVGEQSNWRDYQSSSKSVKELIKRGWNAKYELVEVVGNKAALGTRENHYIMESWASMHKIGKLDHALNLDSGFGEYSRADWLESQLYPHAKKYITK